MDAIRWWLVCMAMGSMIGLVPARADDIRQPLIESGGWATIAERPAPDAAPDACLIVEPDAAVGIRSIGAVFDLMIANAHWDLPAGLHAAIRVTMPQDSLLLRVTGTTSNTASARIDASAMPSLLQAIAMTQRLRVTLFTGMPVNVPLAGFAAALPAFRHCAGLD